MARRSEHRRRRSNRQSSDSPIRVAETPAPANLEGERKTVTAPFAEIKESTALTEGLDPEAAHAIVEPVLRLLEHYYLRATRSAPGGVRQLLQHQALPRKPGQSHPGGYLLQPWTNHSREAAKHQIPEQRTTTTPASAGRRLKLNLMARYSLIFCHSLSQLFRRRTLPASRTIFPNSSRDATHPGGTTTVVSNSSKMSGPCIVRRANAARDKMRVGRSLKVDPK